MTVAVSSEIREVISRRINRLIQHYEARASPRERVQRVLGIWDILFTHCCDSKAIQLSLDLHFLDSPLFA